jgi:hypothetical protein
MNFSIETINKMVLFIMNEGSFAQISSNFPYTASFSDVESVEAVDRFNTERREYYGGLEVLYRSLVSLTPLS